jgi:hypothetical protein
MRPHVLLVLVLLLLLRLLLPHERRQLRVLPHEGLQLQLRLLLPHERLWLQLRLLLACPVAPPAGQHGGHAAGAHTREGWLRDVLLLLLHAGAAGVSCRPTGRTTRRPCYWRTLTGGLAGCCCWHRTATAVAAAIAVRTCAPLMASELMAAAAELRHVLLLPHVRKLLLLLPHVQKLLLLLPHVQKLLLLLPRERCCCCCCPVNAAGAASAPGSRCCMYVCMHVCMLHL